MSVVEVVDSPIGSETIWQVGSLAPTFLRRSWTMLAKSAGRPDWRFMANHLPSIPVEDSIADFVTFFSVFTHLLDEDIFRFLSEAKRVAKPGGQIVFSFLDFECESHWPIFEATLSDQNPQRVINKFISRVLFGVGRGRWA